MRRRTRAGLAAVLLACLAGTARAQYRDPADPGASLPGRPPPSFEPPAGPRGLPAHIDPELRFSNHDRDQFRAWALAEYGKAKCPHGLVKREGHCLPRGQARKRYTVGLPLAPGVLPSPVPLDLIQRLGVPPVGYRYGMIDGDLVKIEVGRSGLAVDAIDGLIPK